MNIKATRKTKLRGRGAAPRFVRLFFASPLRARLLLGPWESHIMSCKSSFPLLRWSSQFRGGDSSATDRRWNRLVSAHYAQQAIHSAAGIRQAAMGSKGCCHRFLRPLPELWRTTSRAISVPSIACRRADYCRPAQEKPGREDAGEDARGSRGRSSERRPVRVPVL